MKEREGRENGQTKRERETKSRKMKRGRGKWLGEAKGRINESGEKEETSTWLLTQAKHPILRLGLR